MSNFIVPNTFVPGTKAKAQEVNENFIAIQNELNQKLNKSGDSTQPLVVGEATENNHAVQKVQLENSAIYLKNYTKALISPFMIKSGNVDSNGEPDILNYENGVISFKVDNGTLYAPITVVPANLQDEFTVTSLASIDLSSYSDGVYNIFIKSNSTAYALCNTIYKQKTVPETPALNDIFVNLSKEPMEAVKYNGENWETFNDVYLGNVTLESGSITSVENSKFNDNGYNLNKGNQIVLKETYAYNHSGYRLYTDGFCEQFGRLGTTTNGYVINLMIPYATTMYNVLLETSVSSTTPAYSVKVSSVASSKTENSFTIIKKDTNSEALYWRTYGMT